MCRKIILTALLALVAHCCFMPELNARIEVSRNNGVTKSFASGVIDGAQVGFTPIIGQIGALFLGVLGPFELMKDQSSDALAGQAGLLVGTVGSAVTHVWLVCKALEKHGLKGGITTFIAPPVVIALLRAYYSSN